MNLNVETAGNLLRDRVIKQLRTKGFIVVDSKTDAHAIDIKLTATFHECAPSGLSSNNSEVIIVAMHGDRTLFTERVEVDKRKGAQYPVDNLMTGHYVRHTIAIIAGSRALDGFSKNYTGTAPTGVLASITPETKSTPVVDDDEVLLQRVADGRVTLSAVKVVLRQPKCIPMPGLLPKIANLKESLENQSEFALMLLQNDDKAVSPPDAYRHWLIEVFLYSERCGLNLDLTDLAANASRTTENEIDRLLKENGCEYLAALKALNLWPYEQQFAQEVILRKFSDAEITRHVWIDTIRDYEKSCSEIMNRRQRIAIKVSCERLERIIGLDDNILVELRSNLLSSLEKGDSHAALSYSQAISQRESALDSRFAADYQARSMALEQQLIAKAGTNKNAAQAEKNGIEKYNDAVNVVNNSVDTVSNTVETVNKTTNAVKNIMSLF